MENEVVETRDLKSYRYRIRRSKGSKQSVGRLGRFGNHVSEGGRGQGTSEVLSTIHFFPKLTKNLRRFKDQGKKQRN